MVFTSWNERETFIFLGEFECSGLPSGEVLLIVLLISGNIGLHDLGKAAE